MYEIPLTRGFVSLIDNNDLDLVQKYSWSITGGEFSSNSSPYYAQARIDGRLVRMHVLIMGRTGVDHKDGNGLNNCRSNLRVATLSQNSVNQAKRPGGTSQYKGVSWETRCNKWKVQITCQGKREFLGYFKDEWEAAVTYNKRAKELFGDFAWQNVGQERGR